MLKRLTCKQWLRAAATRAVRTVAQSAIAAIGSSTMLGGVSWPVVLSTAALAGILSLLTSLAGLPECKDAAADSAAAGTDGADGKEE